MPTSRRHFHRLREFVELVGCMHEIGCYSTAHAAAELARNGVAIDVALRVLVGRGAK